MKRIPSLSFCITCMNRFDQLRNTIGRNLEDNRMFDFLVEFIIVDFGSTDGVKDWIYDNFLSDIKSGYLKYYFTDELKYWNASVAKNTSHLCANNDILVNLDCDNYTGHNGGKFVIKQFMQSNDEIVLHQRSLDPSDGSYGRISIKCDFFRQIGGYDESFEPMGHQDTDLINRAMAAGLRYVYVEDVQNTYNKAILNSKVESVINTGSTLIWKEMQHRNAEKSEHNLSQGRIIANNHILGIKEVYDIFGNKMCVR